MYLFLLELLLIIRLSAQYSDWTFKGLNLILGLTLEQINMTDFTFPFLRITGTILFYQNEYQFLDENTIILIAII